MKNDRANECQLVLEERKREKDCFKRLDKFVCLVAKMVFLTNSTWSAC